MGHYLSEMEDRPAQVAPNRAIYKYELSSFPGVFDVVMPKTNKPLAVQMQGNRPQLWALVDPESEKIRARFEIVGTGDSPECPTVGYEDYIATWQDGPYVWHLFAVGWLHITN